MTIDKAKLKALAEACDSVTTDVHITMAVGSLPEEVKAVQDYLQNSMPSTILALIAEIDDLRKDAERYRWLRSSENQTIFTLDARIDDYIECLPSIVEQDLDAAVDSEISK